MARCTDSADPAPNPSYIRSVARLAPNGFKELCRRREAILIVAHFLGLDTALHVLDLLEGASDILGSLRDELSRKVPPLPLNEALRLAERTKYALHRVLTPLESIRQEANQHDGLKEILDKAEAIPADFDNRVFGVLETPGIDHAGPYTLALASKNLQRLFSEVQTLLDRLTRWHKETEAEILRLRGELANE